MIIKWFKKFFKEDTEQEKQQKLLKAIREQHKGSKRINSEPNKHISVDELDEFLIPIPRILSRKERQALIKAKLPMLIVEFKKKLRQHKGLSVVKKDFADFVCYSAKKNAWWQEVSIGTIGQNLIHVWKEAKIQLNKEDTKQEKK